MSGKKPNGFSIFASQRGEGIVTALISVAILGILGLTVMTLFDTYSKMMTNSYLRMEADKNIAIIRGIVNNPKLCGIGLSGQSWDGNSEKTITLSQGAPGNIAFQEGMMLANGKLRIQRLFLRAPVLPNPTVELHGEAGPINSYMAEIVMRTEIVSSEGGLRHVADRVAVTRIGVNAAGGNAIVTCDLNDKDTGIRPCNPQQAEKDGHACPAATGPNCDIVAYVGEIDMRGQPICHCQTSCDPIPIWQGQQRVNCVSTTALASSVTICPAEARTATPSTECRNQRGDRCFWQENGTPGGLGVDATCAYQCYFWNPKLIDLCLWGCLRAIPAAPAQGCPEATPNAVMRATCH